VLTRTTLILLVFLVGAHHGYAQTATDLEAKYGKAVDGYSVSEHIWMKPEYAADGQVCRMRLSSKRVDTKTHSDSTKLPFNELRNVLNDLVPLETRGARKQGFGATNLGGGTAWTEYEYENVLFTFVSFFRLTSNPKLNPQEFVLLDSNAEPTPEPVKHLTPDKDDFANSESTRTEIVTVRWTARNCVKQ
jgi:hypothetical protein